MTISTILLMIVSIVSAGLLSFLIYYKEVKNKSKLHLFLAFLRFLSLLFIFILLINPKISSTIISNDKPVLAIAVDNSSSINQLKATHQVNQVYQKLISNKELKEKFAIQSYQFDTNLKVSDTFNFAGKESNIGIVAKDLQNINRNLKFPTVLITDGNQTTGTDYEFAFNALNKVFPVIMGDTTRVFDLKVNQVNANKYAYLKNKFPAEVFLQYSGTKNSSASFSIYDGKKEVYKQSVSFTPTNNTAIITTNLTANRLGTVVYKAQVTSANKEVNLHNNSQRFAVEVIDQKSSVAIISTMNHPDLGALKHAIESNEQREVVVLNPKNKIDLSKYKVLIYYQPNTAFREVFHSNKVIGLNSFIITGTKTDFKFLNEVQKDLDFKMSNQLEDYQASFNKEFTYFSTEDIGFENFPPLENSYGKVSPVSSVSILLGSKIRGMQTTAPLLVFSDNNKQRTAYLLGENSWKWRMQNHLNTDSYMQYDLFIDKIIQFLSSNNSKKSLVVNFENSYNSSDAITINAQYFNKNYEFDQNALLTISLLNLETKKTRNYDFLKSNNDFKVSLDGLEGGKYQFTVTEKKSKASFTNTFEVLDFDIEKQAVNPDSKKLQRLAVATEGAAFYPDQVDQLVQALVRDESYKTIQKERVDKVSLIDWYWLLLLVGLTLSLEWLIRKYNGLL
ncbi:hypothetical protein [Flavobacterium frigidarium]|uniref:hypothetical protein n=1 Tax=Flavobacterium frigidarium TaxID=99286 RepID=UPI000417E8D3|nr:hypothetical protein [Flavobacterium frigidarium]